MSKCESCLHGKVCSARATRENLRGVRKLSPCSGYLPSARVVVVDEDMALALCAGAAAIYNMPHYGAAMFKVGGADQRTIPFHDAARELHRVGQALLKLEDTYAV